MIDPGRYRVWIAPSRVLPASWPAGFSPKNLNQRRFAEVRVTRQLGGVTLFY
jgi:hypothetical protein